jgi:hypothetical protein
LSVGHWEKGTGFREVYMKGLRYGAVLSLIIPVFCLGNLAWGGTGSGESARLPAQAQIDNELASALRSPGGVLPGSAFENLAALKSQIFMVAESAGVPREYVHEYLRPIQSFSNKENEDGGAPPGLFLDPALEGRITGWLGEPERGVEFVRLVEAYAILSIRLRYATILYEGEFEAGEHLRAWGLPEASIIGLNESLHGGERTILRSEELLPKLRPDQGSFLSKRIVEILQKTAEPEGGILLEPATIE